MSGANFSNANLRNVNLTRVQALETAFNNANLTGICIEDWNINSKTDFENVICDYVYLENNQLKRSPRDSNINFYPGEFTKLIRRSLNVLEFIFHKSIDWNAFIDSFEKLKIESDLEELSIRGLEQDDNGVLIIKVKSPDNVNKVEIENHFYNEYQKQLEINSKEYQEKLKLKDEQIEIYRKNNADLLKLITDFANKPVVIQSENEEKYLKNYSEKEIINIHGDTHTINIGIKNNVSGQNLAKAAKEIQELLEQLEKSYPTTTTTEQMKVATEAIERIESDSSLKQRIVSALKAGGIQSLKEAIDNPVTNILLSAIEGWKEEDETLDSNKKSK